MMKRLFDITFSLIGIILTAPLMILLAILIKIDSPGPVFYRGDRVGRCRKHFNMLKFRTMVANAEKIGGSSTAADDPRITNGGAFLRKWKLDELPQLFNIFMGKMSFVGPRPEVKEYVDMLLEKEREIILSVTPGLTDLATLQNMSEGERLRGCKNPDAEYMKKIRPMKIKLQLNYVRRKSFILDIKILAHTLWRIVN